MVAGYSEELLDDSESLEDDDDNDNADEDDILAHDVVARVTRSLRVGRARAPPASRPLVFGRDGDGALKV